MAGLIGKTKKPKHGLLRPKIKLLNLYWLKENHSADSLDNCSCPAKPPDYFLAFVSFTGFDFEPFPCIRRIGGAYCTRPIRKMPDFLRKNDGKWSPLRKITAAKSHDFVAAGTPGRIWTSDPSLRSSPASLPSKSIKVKESQYFQGFPALPSQSKQAKINQNQLEKTGQN